VNNLWPRPPPRWAKRLRGVRTRSLRAGLVGGPRPFSLCDEELWPKHRESPGSLGRFGRAV